MFVFWATAHHLYLPTFSTFSFFFFAQNNNNDLTSKNIDCTRMNDMTLALTVRLWFGWKQEQKQHYTVRFSFMLSSTVNVSKCQIILLQSNLISFHVIILHSINFFGRPFFFPHRFSIGIYCQFTCVFLSLCLSLHISLSFSPFVYQISSSLRFNRNFPFFLLYYACLVFLHPFFPNEWEFVYVYANVYYFILMFAPPLSVWCMCLCYPRRRQQRRRRQRRQRQR